VRTAGGNPVINAGLHGDDRLEHIHLGKRTATACGVPVLWPQPVACALIGTPVAIRAPVSGRPLLPLVLALSLVGAVIGVGGACGPLPLSVSRALAGRVGAETWGLRPGMRHKATSAMGTATGAVPGFLLREVGHRKTWRSQEE
jgi:hypothetical protein